MAGCRVYKTLTFDASDLAKDVDGTVIEHLGEEAEYPARFVHQNKSFEGENGHVPALKYFVRDQEYGVVRVERKQLLVADENNIYGYVNGFFFEIDIDDYYNK